MGLGLGLGLRLGVRAWVGVGWQGAAVAGGWAAVA